MGLSCGIIGLPNVGKSTIFNSLTKAKADAENFPFCTIEPNVGIVKVPDERLDEITKRIQTQKIVPAVVKITDIAGLVKGAAAGEGLGNKFLSHIRECSAILHVVRCFEDKNVTHVDGTIDALRDISTITTELILADLETVQKRISSLEKDRKRDPKGTTPLLETMNKVKLCLEKGDPVRSISLKDKELQYLKELHLITQKPVLYVANLNDEEIAHPEENKEYKKLEETAKNTNNEIIAICGKIEQEIAELEEREKKEFLSDLGIEEEGLSKLIRNAYELLGLQTYFTAGEKEVRAWTIPKDCLAPKAAGVIHSDFQAKFIKAEVYHYEDLLRYNNEAEIKANGRFRIEGKDYIVKDGDIMHFRCNA